MLSTASAAGGVVQIAILVTAILNVGRVTLLRKRTYEACAVFIDIWDLHGCAGQQRGINSKCDAYDIARVHAVLIDIQRPTRAAPLPTGPSAYPWIWVKMCTT